MRRFFSSLATIASALMLVGWIGLADSPMASATELPVVSAAVAGNGDRFAFWNCHGGAAFCEAYYDAASKRWSAEKPLHVGQIDSAPSISIDANPHHEAGLRADPYIYLFWAGGASDDLHEEYWTGRWHGPIDLHMGAEQYGPRAPRVWYFPGPEAVAWVNTSGHITYATSTNPTSAKSWKGPLKRNVGTPVTQVSVIDAGGGDESIWWQGKNHNLYSASLITVGGSVKYGPCDFKGSLHSAPSVAWLPSDPTPVAPSTSAKPATAKPATSTPTIKTSGNCPHGGGPHGPEWFGTFGGYYLCWAGNAKHVQGLWCTLWFLHPGGSVEIQGPLQIGSVTNLGSPPALALWPNVNQHALAFWQGNDIHQDLWMMDLIGKRKKVNLGFGPLTSG